MIVYVIKIFFLDATNSKEKKKPQEELSFVSVSGPLSIILPKENALFPSCCCDD